MRRDFLIVSRKRSGRDEPGSAILYYFLLMPFHKHASTVRKIGRGAVFFGLFAQPYRDQQQAVATKVISGSVIFAGH